MNKVDLDLFILCRLCLEKGTYQIIPSIQEQIKTCYGIVVDVFDGLPQLICQKCKTNVEHHYTTKLLYIEKQNSLKQRIESQKALEEQESDVTIPHELTSKRPKLRKLSSNTEESSTSVNFNELESTSWESDYRKQYYCRLCNYTGKSMKSMNLHRLWHSHLENKHCDLFNKYCYVKLDKFDEKPNVTGRYDTVMLNNKKIIKSHDKYFITYTPKRSLRCRDNESPERIKIPSKRNRILSNSSGETVVFDANENENITQDAKVSESIAQDAKVNESIAQDAKVNDSITQSKENIENDCIQISSDESNTDEEEADRSIIKKPLLVKSNDFKTIENISSNCYSKYMKKMEDKRVALPVCSTDMESLLNHKVLCIGRKVLLNGNYMNCNGLFRFLEYKNLPIIWVPYSRDSNIVIRTYLKSNVQAASDDINWSYMFKTGTENVPLETYIASVALKRNQLNIDKLQTTLVPITAESVETKCKILNANPVPNPKQMPSKVNNEVKSGNKSKSDINITDTGIEIDSEENHFSLPIITHTTSLAPITNEKPIYPKIKVKSVSELMTEEALKNLATEQVPLNFMSGNSVSDSATESNSVKENHGINFYLPNIPEGPSHEARNNIHTLKATSKNNQIPENNQIFINNTTSIVNEKKVILDTAEFPHTKTNSPFQYLKNLLLCHNLTLLDSRAEIISEFTCLVKFKVAFKQDLTEPVTFDMQLYYSMGSFCIIVKDKNLGDIAFEILTADWQWEIIKTFKGSVINKILSNAKKVSMTAYKDTEQFLLLLNSIKCQKVD